jgi:hypothetical protein
MSVVGCTAGESYPLSDQDFDICTRIEGDFSYIVHIRDSDHQLGEEEAWQKRGTNTKYVCTNTAIFQTTPRAAYRNTLTRVSPTLSPFSITNTGNA